MLLDCLYSFLRVRNRNVEVSKGLHGFTGVSPALDSRQWRWNGGHLDNPAGWRCSIGHMDHQWHRSAATSTLATKLPRRQNCSSVRPSYGCDGQEPSAFSACASRSASHALIVPAFQPLRLMLSLIGRGNEPSAQRRLIVLSLSAGSILRCGD